MAKFKRFSSELKRHSRGKYHILEGPIKNDTIVRYFESLDIKPISDYLEFLNKIGPGSFFGGSIQIFPLMGNEKTIRTLNEVIELFHPELLGIGTDGTTEGCFCIERNGNSEKVYDVSRFDGGCKTVSDCFCTWIEELPNQFTEDDFLLYAPKSENVVDFIEGERKKFNVSIDSFDLKRVREPNDTEGFLSSFNRVTFVVEKLDECIFKKLTVKVWRKGSSLGDKNWFHAHVDITDLEIGSPKKITTYVFDPYCLPFREIEVNYKAEIDKDMQGAYCEFKQLKENSNFEG